MKKLQDIKNLWDTAWKYCSLYIRLRDTRDRQGRCITCGKIIPVKEANAGHYIHKSRSSAIYFDEFNIHLQCVRCNKYMGGQGAIYSKKLIEMYGIEKFNELHKRSTESKKWSRQELEEIRDKYKIRSEELTHYV